MKRTLLPARSRAGLLRVARTGLLASAMVATVMVVPAGTAQAAGAPITAVASGLCLDVVGDRPAAGAQAELATCDDGESQTWLRTKAGELRVFGRDYCLTAPRTSKGAKLVIRKCSDEDKQKFDKGTRGSLVTRSGKLCVAPAANPDAGTRVVLAACTGKADQRWKIGGGGGNPPGGGDTPVERWGQLRVCGVTMCDKNGRTVQPRGVSSMWLNWEDSGYAESATQLKWMRDTWGITLIRAAMGVEPAGAYLSNPDKARRQVETIIKNAVDAGVYVVVDWHSHEAERHQQQAVAFFSDLAQRYGHLPNLIWEPYNEPLQVSWSQTLKPYHQAVISAIRAHDPDNIIILGTPSWSQEVDKAAADPVAGTNLMYTLHFYSCTHTSWLRERADAARKAGLALFVTEWGGTHADGGLDGKVCESETQAWIDWMKANAVPWAAWKLDDCTDSSCLLNPGTPVNSDWNQSLHGHARLVVAGLKG